MTSSSSDKDWWPTDALYDCGDPVSFACDWNREWRSGVIVITLSSFCGGFKSIFLLIVYSYKICMLCFVTMRIDLNDAEDVSQRPLDKQVTKKVCSGNKGSCLHNSANFTKRTELYGHQFKANSSVQQSLVKLRSNMVSWTSRKMSILVYWMHNRANSHI